MIHCTVSITHICIVFHNVTFCMRFYDSKGDLSTFCGSSAVDIGDRLCLLSSSVSEIVPIEYGRMWYMLVVSANCVISLVIGDGKTYAVSLNRFFGIRNKNSG